MQGRYTMTFPDYTIGVEAYEKIREVCPRYGKTVVVIGGRRGIEAAQKKMIQAVEGVGMEFTGFLLAGDETTYENIDKIGRDQAVADADMIFAVGGGKAIDTAKQVAHNQHKPFFTFPTVAGSCAAAASIAMIYHTDGTFCEYAYSTEPPIHVFLCTRMLAQAPVDYLLRGISDTMAKYYEAQIAARGATLCHRDGMGLALSRMCLDPFYTYGQQAIADNREKKATKAFEETVLAIVMTSGLVSNLAAPEYNGHIAHTLFTELTNISAGESGCERHSGLAAYGILLLLLCDKQQDEFRRFYAFCQQIGLPTSRRDICADEGDIQRVFQATEQKQDSKSLPYRITQDMLYKAAEELEAYGR